MKKNIKEIVSSSKLSTLSVTIWDILQISTLKNPSLDLLLYIISKLKNGYTIARNLPSILTQKLKLTKY